MDFHQTNDASCLIEGSHRAKFDLLRRQLSFLRCSLGENGIPLSVPIRIPKDFSAIVGDAALEQILHVIQLPNIASLVLIICTSSLGRNIRPGARR